jgi:hypothetical protein
MRTSKKWWVPSNIARIAVGRVTTTAKFMNARTRYDSRAIAIKVVSDSA